MHVHQKPRFEVGWPWVIRVGVANEKTAFKYISDGGKNRSKEML